MAELARAFRGLGGVEVARRPRNAPLTAGAAARSPEIPPRRRRARPRRVRQWRRFTYEEYRLLARQDEPAGT